MYIFAYNMLLVHRNTFVYFALVPCGTLAIFPIFQRLLNWKALALLCYTEVFFIFFIPGDCCDRLLGFQRGESLLGCMTRYAESKWLRWWKIRLMQAYSTLSKLCIFFAHWHNYLFLIPDLTHTESILFIELQDLSSPIMWNWVVRLQPSL